MSDGALPRRGALPPDRQHIRMRQTLIQGSEHYQEDLRDKEDHQTDTPLPYLTERERCSNYL